MKAIIPSALTLALTACGGGGSEPLKKEPTQGEQPTPSAKQCGEGFVAERHFNSATRNSVFWQIEGDTLQTRPSLTLAPDKFSTSATYTYNGENALCLQTAKIFGSANKESWQGSNNTSVNTGQLIGYVPELSMQFSLPNVQSLSDWRSKDSPTEMNTELERAQLAVWYVDANEQRFIVGDISNNQSTVALNCANTSFSVALKLEAINDAQSSNLNPSYCETISSGTNSVTQCLTTQLNLPSSSFNCEMALSNIILPDSQGNKTQVKIATQLTIDPSNGAFSSLSDIEVN